MRRNSVQAKPRYTKGIDLWVEPPLLVYQVGVAPNRIDILQAKRQAARLQDPLDLHLLSTPARKKGRTST